MSLRRSIAALTAVAAVAAPAAVAPPAAADDPLGPLGPLVPGTAFGVLDPVIEVLPPFPVPHTPYVGELCPDGADACIDEVITEMQTRLDGLAAACDHDAVFALAYLRVTENVRDAVRTGHFRDPKWLNQVDTVFAQLYFDVRDDWHAGRRGQVPQAWAIALKAEDDKAMTGLGNFMLAMNAHINRDFPHVLAEVGLTAPDGTSHKRDHNAYNQRLDSLYRPVFAEEAARFDPRFDDIDVSTLEETVAGVIMRGWREGVWRHAESLATATTPLQRRVAEREIEVYAATQAVLMRAMFAAPNSDVRDAWCAEHQG
jgi:hypothetical protein